MVLTTNVPYLKIFFCAAAFVGLVCDFDSMDHRGEEAATFYLRHGPSSSKEKPKLTYQMNQQVDKIGDANDEHSEARRTLKETNDRPIFSVIDITYDDYAQDLPIFETEVFDNDIANKQLGAESVTPRSTLVTLPIFVIGFSGTIVVCGLWMLFSEFRARRKPDKDLMTQSSSRIMKSSHSLAQPSSQSISRRSRSSVLRGLFLRDGSNVGGNDKVNQFTATPKYALDGCGNNHFGGSIQSFPCGTHLHRDREILFYRSGDSSMSIASTITQSLPSQSRTKQIGTNYVTDSPTQYRNSCNIMELTDIHRVSTDMALEDLVELSTISATGITIASQCSDMAVVQDEVSVMNLRGVSDFDAGNLYITEVMENDDCSYIAESDDNSDIHIQEESAVESGDKSNGMDESKDAKREGCISANTTIAASKISPTSISSSDERIQVTTGDNTGSLNTVRSAEEVESPSPDFVLGEQSLLPVAKENMNSEVESEDNIVQRESSATDGERSSGFARVFKRRGCGDWVDFVRSSSSTSTDDSTKTNSKSQEDQVCQEENNCDDDLHLENEIKDEPEIEEKLGE